MRLLRFASSVWKLRSFIFRSPVNWRNLRACWIQSDPDWRDKLPLIELTDEEFDAFMEATE